MSMLRAEHEARLLPVTAAPAAPDRGPDAADPGRKAAPVEAGESGATGGSA